MKKAKVINEFLIAGFGGQGILFSGKLLAYFGLLDGKEVSWLPSYGPAMRGGTCNCSVCINDEPIGSPLVLQPDVLLVMNTPSYTKFASTVKAGGLIVADSTLIDSECFEKRGDIETFFIPATQIALDNDLKGMANIIMLGKLIEETALCSHDTIKTALGKVVPSNKAHLIDANLKAIELGAKYKQ